MKKINFNKRKYVVVFKTGEGEEIQKLFFKAGWKWIASGKHVIRAAFICSTPAGILYTDSLEGQEISFDRAKKALKKKIKKSWLPAVGELVLVKKRIKKDILVEGMRKTPGTVQKVEVILNRSTVRLGDGYVWRVTNLKPYKGENYCEKCGRLCDEKKV